MSIGSAIQRPEKPKNRWNWLLWWRIDPVDLDEEVRLYDSFSLTGCMRGFSVLFLIISMVITIVMIAFRADGLNPLAFFDVGIFGIFAVFIYFGHRWAMLGAMVLWTLEKVVHVIQDPGLIIPDVLWWAIYMHAFYFAFRVEQRRRELARAAEGNSMLHHPTTGSG